MNILQIQIACYGEEGMKRLSSSCHPQIEGIEWVVSWQCKDNCNINECFENRKDFKILCFNDCGVSLNRNHLLEHYFSKTVKERPEFILIADDDISYNEAGLKRLVEYLNGQAVDEAGLFCCRFTIDGRFHKPFRPGGFDISKPVKGWWPSGVEMVIKGSRLGNLRFDTRFGPPDGEFVCGEDSIMFHSLIRAGVKGRALDICIGNHPGESTGSKRQSNDFLRAQSEILRLAYPKSWPVRIIAKAWRSELPFFTALRALISR